MGTEGTEFLITSRALLPHVLPLVSDVQDVLVVGAGTSELSALLHGFSIKGLVSMDNDPAAIEQMKAAHGDMQWDLMDVCEMSYADNKFEVVLDKSLLDFLIYTARDEHQIARMLQECGRVTRPGGKCVFLSWCPPGEMSVHLSGCRWVVDEVTSTRLETTCDENGRVPYDAAVGLSVGSEEGLKTNFYLYVCTVEAEPAAPEQDGFELAEAGDCVEAIQAFQVHLNENPVDARTHEAVAQCYLMMDEPAQVRHSVLMAARCTLLEPTWAAGHLTLARSHLACSNFGLAVTSFRKALELDPGLGEEVGEDLDIALQQMEKKQNDVANGGPGQCCVPCAPR